MDREQFLVIGKIVKAQGIKGEVRILPYSGDAGQLTGYRTFYLAVAREDGAGAPPEKTAGQRVLKSRIHGKFLVSSLEGVATRNEAEALVGREVWIEKQDLAELAEDEFYWHELVGMTAFGDDGAEIGVVASLFATGAHDVLVVRGHGREYMIPACREFIADIDYTAKKLVVALVPGLLDMNL